MTVASVFGRPGGSGVVGVRTLSRYQQPLKHTPAGFRLWLVLALRLPAGPAQAFRRDERAEEKLAYPGPASACSTGIRPSDRVTDHEARALEFRRHRCADTVDDVVDRARLVERDREQVMHAHARSVGYLEGVRRVQTGIDVGVDVAA